MGDVVVRVFAFKAADVRTLKAFSSTNKATVNAAVMVA